MFEKEYFVNRVYLKGFVNTGEKYFSIHTGFYANFLIDIDFWEFLRENYFFMK